MPEGGGGFADGSQHPFALYLNRGAAHLDRLKLSILRKTFVGGFVDGPQNALSAGAASVLNHQLLYHTDQ